MLRPPHPHTRSARRTPNRVPTLLVWAADDGALGPQLLRGTERHVTKLRVVTLPRCSHWVAQDQCVRGGVGNACAHVNMRVGLSVSRAGVVPCASAAAEAAAFNAR